MHKQKRNKEDFEEDKKYYRRLGALSGMALIVGISTVVIVFRMLGI